MVERIKLSTTTMKQKVIKNRAGVILYVALAIATGAFVSNGESKEISRNDAVPGEAEDVCKTQACLATASEMMENMDLSYDPCDNFYRYACGGYKNGTSPPAIIGQFDIKTEIIDQIEKNLMMIADGDSKPNESTHLKVYKRLHKACMNDSDFWEAPARKALEIVQKFGTLPTSNAVPNKTAPDWISSTVELREAGYRFDHFIDIQVQPDEKNTGKHVIYLNPGNSYFASILGANGTHRGRVLHLARQFYGLLKVEHDPPIEHYKKLTQFVVDLKNIADKHRVPDNSTITFNPKSLIDLTKEWPSVAWKEFLSKMVPSLITVNDDKVIIVRAPGYISDLIQLMSLTPKELVRDFLTLEVARDSVIQMHLDWPTNNANEKYPGSWQCTFLIRRILPNVTAAAYVTEYITEEAINKAVAMATNLKTQMTQYLEKVTWMDNKTRQGALETIAGITTVAGYPDGLLDNNKAEQLYEKLHDCDDFLGCVFSVIRRDQDMNFARLGEAVNITTPHITWDALVGDTIFAKGSTHLILPAAILGIPMFSPDLPEYINYSRLGKLAIELGHASTDRARQSDENGDHADWWGQLAETKYNDHIRCIREQHQIFNASEVGADIWSNDWKELDMGTSMTSTVEYHAYKNWSAKHGVEPKLPGFESRPSGQMFWLSYATSYCQKSDDHPFEVRDRMKFTLYRHLWNSAEFAKDFNCPRGSVMNPEKKCLIW